MSPRHLPLLLTALRALLGPAYVLALAAALALPGNAATSGSGRPRGALVATAAGGSIAAGHGSASSHGAALPFLPLALALLASASDFVDGRLARRLGATSRTGAMLDVAADGTFLLCALGALAAHRLVSWALPLAAAAALCGLALHWRAGAPATNRARGVADRLGHLAGVLNYAVVLVASAVALGWVPPELPWVASWLVALVDLAPLVARRRAG